MITVKAYLAPLSIHGTSLFATERIPANAVIWQYTEQIDNNYFKEISENCLFSCDESGIFLWKEISCIYYEKY
jgi:hypothetical protein